MPNTGKLVAVSEWIFRTRASNKKSVSFDADVHDEATLLKQIGSVEQVTDVDLYLNKIV